MAPNGVFESLILKKDNVIINCYSVAVINLPINTINTAGATKPIMGTKTEGRRFENSDGIIRLTSLNTLVFI
ncbi:hypothetical protein EU96_0292 [Prochlorococcus marinus str. MIT 9302]|uniref:Uncharacterized protein n=1 Tax=Prochlorococcus marinus str. MIT 9302 TaxID=74545 RepID=A0A0A2AAR0_PROMR|nr:hypothetical protein EU96_0292 [Prochlorococcus marinus str. MIT 9302]